MLAAAIVIVLLLQIYWEPPKQQLTQYSKKGFSITVPADWELVQDGYEIKFGERSVEFSIAEYSHASYMIRYQGDDFKQLAKRLIEKYTMAGYETWKKSIVSLQEIKLAGYETIEIVTLEEFPPPSETTKVLIVNIPATPNSPQVVVYAREVDIYDLADTLEETLPTIQVNYDGADNIEIDW